MHRVVCSIFLLLALAACAPSRQAAPPTPTVPAAELPERAPVPPGEEQAATFKIGLLLPLSGPESDLGRAFLNAAQMAVFTIGDARLELLPRDTAGTSDGARRAAKVALADGAQILLGPVFNQAVGGAGAVARQAGVPLIGFSNDRTVAGDGVFLMGFPPTQQVERVLRYAVNEGLQDFAALLPETPYGDAVSDAFVETVMATPARFVTLERYPPDPDLLTAPVKSLADYDARRRALLAERRDLESFGEDDPLAQELLKRLEPKETLGEVPFEALLIPDGGALLRSLAPLLPYYEVDPQRVQFLGTALWEDSSLTREPALAGGWFAGPPTAGYRRFGKKYAALYGGWPPRLATLAYDGVALAASLGLPRVNALKGQPLPAEPVRNRNGFRGLDGIFRFTPSGMAERGLAVMEITGSGFRIISPAPQTFQYLGL